MTRESLGELEHLILLSILRLGPEVYGVPIIKEIEERTGRSVSQAAAYLTLRRLEEKGWIASRLGDPTPERGGRAKRYFRLRAAGKRRLTDARSALLEMWDGVAPQLDRS
jgi:DNA-binding PadR family transcriptional regulator